MVHSPSTLHGFRLFFIRALLGVLPMSVWAQFGSIRGDLTDPSGAVLPGAAVTVTNVETGTATRTVTQDNGAYLVQVPAGFYRVSAELSGFKHTTTQLIQVNVDQAVVINLTLEVGGTSTTETEIELDSPTKITIKVRDMDRTTGK